MGATTGLQGYIMPVPAFNTYLGGTGVRGGGGGGVGVGGVGYSRRRWHLGSQLCWHYICARIYPVGLQVGV